MLIEDISSFCKRQNTFAVKNKSKTLVESCEWHFWNLPKTKRFWLLTRNEFLLRISHSMSKSWIVGILLCRKSWFCLKAFVWSSSKWEWTLFGKSWRKTYPTEIKHPKAYLITTSPPSRWLHRLNRIVRREWYELYLTWKNSTKNYKTRKGQSKLHICFGSLNLTRNLSLAFLFLLETSFS